MIAKCSYGEFLQYRKEFREALKEGNEVEETLIHKLAKSYVEYTECEDKIVDIELASLAKSLTGSKN